MSKKGVLIGAGLVTGGIAIGVGISHAITNGLVKLAIHREPPKNIDKAKTKIRRTPAEQKFDAYWEETANKLKNTECEDVKLKSRDGLQLIGHWYPCENPKRVIEGGIK